MAQTVGTVPPSITYSVPVIAAARSNTRNAIRSARDLDLDRIVQTVTDIATELTGAKFGAFFYNVLDDAGESYMLYSLSGAPRSAFERFAMPRNTAVLDPTFKGECVVRSDDIRSDPRYGKNEPHFGMPKGHLPVVSYLAVPVIGRSGASVLFFQSFLHGLSRHWRGLRNR